MNDVIILDGNFSTTRLVTKEYPVLESKPEYKIELKLFLKPNAQRKIEGGHHQKTEYYKEYIL